MSVYTKKGDRGKTSILNGKRILKNSKIISAIGAIDELNSYLGVIGGLTDIQDNLFTINSILAGSKLKLSKDITKRLESKIDKMEAKLPVQTNFLIYGGCLKSRRIYFARALCRRAERKLVALRLPTTDYGPQVYLNRLSDYLFILARYTNFKNRVKEKVWKN